jgi:hypothetical protein
MKLEFSRQVFGRRGGGNPSNIKFHQNPPRWSRDVPCGRTDMTKLILTFRNFANAPKDAIFESFDTLHVNNNDFSNRAPI